MLIFFCFFQPVPFLSRPLFLLWRHIFLARYWQNCKGTGMETGTGKKMTPYIVTPTLFHYQKTKNKLRLLPPPSPPSPFYPQSTRLPSSGAPRATSLSALPAGPSSTPVASAACTLTARSPRAVAFPPKPLLRTAQTPGRSRQEKALSRRLRVVAVAVAGVGTVAVVMVATAVWEEQP